MGQLLHKQKHTQQHIIMTQLHQAIQNIQDIIHKYTLKQQQIITLLHSKQHKLHNTSRTHHKKLYVLYQKHIQQLQQQIIIHTHYICQIEHMHITYSHVHALKHTQLYLQKQQDIHKLQHIIQHVHTQLQHIQDVGEDLITDDMEDLSFEAEKELEHMMSTFEPLEPPPVSQDAVAHAMVPKMPVVGVNEVRVGQESVVSTEPSTLNMPAVPLTVPHVTVQEMPDNSVLLQ